MGGSRWARPLGLALGCAADALFGDPVRLHPVAGFGAVAARLERRVHRDSRARGAAYTVALVGGAVGLGAVADRGHPLWRLAERLGARVVSEPGTSTTHVVAKCVGTDLTHKAMWGLQYLKHIVSPAWVEASAMMWTRQDEGRFPVKRPK